MFGSQSAFMCELFGSQHRYLGVSLAREVSAVFAGGLAPLIGAWIISRVVAADGGKEVPGAGLGSWVFIAGYLCILTGITVATTFITPDPINRDLEDPRDAIDVARAEPQHV
jgi:MHS family metabolite:H+ symporter-like MFS transporter